MAQLSALEETFTFGNDNQYLNGMQMFFYRLQEIDFIPQNAALNLQLDNDLNNRDAQSVHLLSSELHRYLDDAYHFGDHFKGFNRIFRVAVLIALIMVVVASFSPLRKRYFKEKEMYASAGNEEKFREMTLRDITRLKQAIDRYYNDNRSYPKSSGGWDAVIANYGESRKDWIPGLAPKYINELPHDPRKSKDPGNQYMYKSDGKDFKLLAHRPVGMSDIVMTHPALADPVRPSWAFGYWTEGAKNW
jgi:hypothetical protein